MNSIVFGASGGIGSALVETLVKRGEYDNVFAVSRRCVNITGATHFETDLGNEAGLSDLANELKQAGPLHLCIVATGMLFDAHVKPEKSFRHQSRTAFEKLFQANTIVPALIAKHMLPLMPRKERAVFAALSARVGSITDNKFGGWHAYRASKAALNMLIKNYAIEQAHRSECFIATALHPGTVDTELSKPFQNNLPAEQLFTAEKSARHLLDVIDGLRATDSGRIFDWAGKEIPS